jgi:hypothetical protein
MIITRKLTISSIAIFAGILVTACFSGEPEGLLKAAPAATTVKMDFFHKPLPEIPLPINLATRYDETSATGRRINASMVAPTQFESHVRELIDGLDGWGVFQPITIPFTDELDVNSITAAHRDPNYGLDDDVIYLVNIDPASSDFGRVHYLDLGNGNYPVALEDIDGYWENDPRGDTISLTFEETDEDQNGNGILDPGEDTDADGTLDRPNYYPGANPDADDLAGRADALMTFYERETNTLIVRPMTPLDERTTYAIIVTRRLLDINGKPVGSPYSFVNHTGQTKELKPLLDVMPAGLAPDEIAFTFSFTTQTIQSAWKAVRDGLYGEGIQGHIGREFPAEIAGFEQLLDEEYFTSSDNLHLMYAEDWVVPLEAIGTSLLGLTAGTEEYRVFFEAQRFVDYYIIGKFNSPQLFAREDAQGNWLDLNDQRWPEDLDRVPAPVRNEEVYFHIAVPRKEVSARGEGNQVPLVLLSHGHGSSRIEIASFGGHFARHGLATIAIDCVSHGIGGLGEFETAMISTLLDPIGFEPLRNALFTDRALDFNNDGIKDSGYDFWTSYLFHTRDLVRQSALDYMQLVRIIRSFDGNRKWNFDLNGDGENELAGDFDGDGNIEFGQGSTISMVGASLGGIVSAVVGSLEPEITAIVPISGGGGLGDVSLRSDLSNVREPVILRIMGPLFIGTTEAGTGKMLIETLVPDPSKTGYAITTVEGVGTGDTMIVENLVSGELGCGYVSEQGNVRASLATDKGDAIRILFYSGNALAGGKECEIVSGTEPAIVVDAFGQEVIFQGETIKGGTPLVSLAAGFGLRRANPELRRMMVLGQVVLDAADPAVYARHMLQEPLVYPGTGQQTGTHAMITTTNGDMSVPASTGLTLARSAGLVNFIEDDPRYGKPANQVLIDTYISEAVHSYKRYTDPDGNGVMMDVENFAEGGDPWGNDIPRLDPPLRLGFDTQDPLGGTSGALFPYDVPDGMHGFPFPGQMKDMARQKCEDECPADQTCDCDAAVRDSFDIGSFLFNLFGRYLASGGQVMNAEACLSHNNCPDFAPVPEDRGTSQ